MLGVKEVGNTEKASVDQPEAEYEHVMHTYCTYKVHRLWHFFLAAITNTKVYQKKTLHVLKSNTEARMCVVHSQQHPS